MGKHGLCVQCVLYLLVAFGGDFHSVNVESCTMPILGQFPDHRCSGGAHCLFRFPVTVDTEAGLVLKVLVLDVIILVTFNVVK